MNPRPMSKFTQPPRRLARRYLRKLKLQPRGSLEYYAEEFDDTARAFEKFLRRCPRRRIIDSRPPVGIVVTPWVSTPGPWLFITLALGLAERGRRVVLIWDDVAYPTPGHDVTRQNRAIARILDQLRDSFEIAQLSQEPAQPPRADDDAALHKLVDQNLIWWTRGAKIGMADSAAGQVAHASLRQTLGLARGLLARQQFDYLVITSGVVLNSGVYRIAAHQANVRVATYDAGFGVIFISTDGIATQQHDIPRALREMARADTAQLDTMRAKARHEFELRRVGHDKQNFQITAAQNSAQNSALVPQDAIVLPLSLEWDGAALGSHYLFENTVDWVCSTVDFCLKNSAHPIVVRQHPGERVSFGNSKLDMRAQLAQRFGDEPRIVFVDKHALVNTYDLLARATIVLPFVSTVAIEAAALDKVVLISGLAYYRDLGFVYAPQTRAEYFQYLERGIRGTLPRLPNQVEQAWLCYYATQCCNFVWTDFTAQPPDFWKWVGKSPAQVFGDDVFQDVLTACDENIPLALLRHRRRFAEIKNPASRISG